MLKALFLTVLLSAMTYVCFARIWRVNNSPGVASDFTTLQAAHDKASPGDTLHVEGSTIEYNYILCRKKLIIIGPGYYLAENPDTQELQQTAKVKGCYFYSGSSGSIVMGLELKGDVEIWDSGVTVKRNKFNSSVSGEERNVYSLKVMYSQANASNPLTDIIISQNYGLRMSVAYQSSRIFVSNNYFTVPDNQPNSSCINIDKDSETTIQNNILRRGKVSVSPITVFTNNIMYAGSLEGEGKFIAHNIWSGNQHDTTNGNKTGVDMSSVFVGMVNGKYIDAQWKLKTGSPAIGAGFGSTPENRIDAGMYSGGTPYVISGMPPIPHIYSLEITPVGSNAIPIKVKVKVKSGG